MVATLRWFALWPGNLVTVWIAAFVLSALVLWRERLVAGREVEQGDQDAEQRHADMRRAIRRGARRADHRFDVGGES